MRVRFPDEDSTRLVGFGPGPGDRFDPSSGLSRYRLLSEAESERPALLAQARRLGQDMAPQALTLVLAVEASGRERALLRGFCARVAAALETEIDRRFRAAAAAVDGRHELTAELVPVSFSGRRPKQGPPSARFELRLHGELRFFSSAATAELLAFELGARLERLARGPLVTLCGRAEPGAPARLELVCVRAELAELSLRLLPPRLLYNVERERLLDEGKPLQSSATTHVQVA